MAILSRPRVSPQQRWDLEDYTALLAALRTDSKLWTKQFLSDENLVLKGFSVSGNGLKEATINMADATLILPQNSFDFSYFISSPSEANITVTDAELTDNARNYLELELQTANGTPLTKAFWDPEANSGQGQEFSQIVDTITDLQINVVVSTGGFSGSSDRIPLAIVETDASGIIRIILDKRPLFGRLAKPSDIDNEYSWGTKVEPSYVTVLSSVTGTFEAGEQVSIGSETGTVKTGGTTNIELVELSGDNFTVGDTVTGANSGATGTLVSSVEQFTGVDKSLGSIEKILKAIMTEIKLMKKTSAWYKDADVSLGGISDFNNSIITAVTSTAKWSWTSPELSITDDEGSPADADPMAYIRVLGKGSDVRLTRQDSNSTPITILDGQVLFVKLPASGNRDFSGSGSSDTNFQVVNIADFVPSDENYWLAYREDVRLYVRGYGELESGESTPISDPDKEAILAAIDANQVSANQDRSAKLVQGGTFSNNEAGDEITLSAEAFLQIPGIPLTRNRVAPQSISLPNVGSVAYVEINRDTGPQVTLTVGVADTASLALTDDMFLIARRTSDGILVGSPQTFLLKPGEYLELDGSLAEINRYFGQLRLGLDSDPSRINISSADKAMLDNTNLAQELNSYLIDFDGVVIDFDSGDIYESDGVTPISSFTPFSIPVGEYFWYGLSLNASGISSDNRQTVEVQLSEASASNADMSLAPKPLLTGSKKLGAVQLYNDSGTLIVVDLLRLGTGSGSGGSSGIKATFLDPVSTVLPTGPSVTIDGISGQDDDLVLFTNLSSGNNRIYKLSGVGSAIAWTEQRPFSGSLDPEDGDSVRITKGLAFQEQLAVFNGTDFRVNDVVRLFNGVSANFWELGSIKESSLADNTSGNLFSVNAAGSENMIIYYSIIRGSLKETGQLILTSDGLTAAVSRAGAYIGTVGVEFTAAINSGDLELNYETSNLGSGATMKYFLMRWSNASGGPTGVPSYASAGSGSSTAAAGTTGDIQFNGSGGNLDADTRLKWDGTEGALNMNGLIRSALKPAITLNDAQGSFATIITQSASSYKFTMIEYSIERNGLFRTGRMLIANDATSGVGFSDDFVETGSTGISFQAIVNAGNLEVQYISTSTGFTGSFKYSIKKWN